MSRPLLIFILGLFFFSTGSSQSSDITASDPPLSEVNLDAGFLTVVLDGETFTDYTTLHLNATGFVLVGAPTGTSVESVAGSSATEAQINLAFDGTDFDSDYSLSLDIDFSLLTVTASGVLSSENTVPIDAYEESAGIDDPGLNEAALDGQTLTVTLTEETFSDPGLLVPGDFIMNNAPGGLTSVSFVGTPSTTEAVLDLQFIPGDFDTHITNFSITIAASLLSQSITDLTTNEITITSLDESAGIDDPGLNEAALDGQTLTVTLTEETFSDPGLLVPGDFIMNNAPGGLTSVSFVGTPSTTEAVLDLQFIPGDFDTDITNFSITIAASLLSQSITDLTTNEITITSLDESAGIDDPGLNEAALDGQTLTVTLTEETFSDPGLLVPGDFIMNNAPGGLTSVSFVGTPSSTEAVLDLQFIPGDFDTHITNFSITIAASLLSQSITDLTTNEITITSLNESAGIDDPGLNEAALDGQTLTVTLTEETFSDPGLLVPGDFIMNNAPGGLTSVSFVGTPSSTEAVLDLQFIPGDFDTDITNFSITIAASLLSQSITDLTTNEITITSLNESAEIDDPGLNETDLDGQFLTITLANETFVDLTPDPNHFTLNNAPGGLTIESFTEVTTISAVMNLAFLPGDFDTGIPDFSISIDPAALSQTSDELLTTNAIAISADNELATINDPTLNETDLDGQSLTITLANETFVDLTPDPNHFTLNNAPGGLTIESFTEVTTSSAVMNLAFLPGDFDAGIPDFSISIDPAALSQTSDELLTTNAIAISADIESVAIDDPSLNEADLDGQSLTITLANETFADLTLDPDNFTLNNAPGGLTIESFTAVTPSTAVLNLAFLPGDFDGSYTNFSISIDATELNQTSGPAITSNEITITAFIESATMNAPTALFESTLDGQTVTITLLNETYDAALESANFVLGGTSGVDYPAGLSILSVGRTNATVAVVTLAFDGTDFDSDFTNAYITIDNADLAQTSTGVLTPSNRLTINAFVEVPQATLSADSTLEERRLDARTLTIDLTQETFSDPGLLVPGNFTLNNAPGGLSIEGFAGTPSGTQAILDLAFTPGDFDTDIANFSISIDPSVLIQSGTDLITNVLPVIGNIESATLAPDPLTEGALNGQVITITLNNEFFDPPSFIDATNFVLINEPGGLTINSAVATSATVAQLTLQYTGGDFDTDITNFAVGIIPVELRYTSGGNLITSPITIQALVENPVATLTGPALSEYTLNGNTVSITFTEETFIDPGSLVAGNFELLNEPPGLTIQSIGSLTSTSLDIVLGFNLTDFDIVYPNFRISIDNTVLTQSGADLTSSSLSIGYGLEPVVTGVSIPNDTMLIGSVVEVTIFVESDQSNLFSLAGGFIGGYPLAGLERQDETTYTSSFTVNEGGDDYPASQDIHVLDLQLMNGLIPGEVYTNAYIIQDSDPIDANRPLINYIYTTITGPQNIGSEITLWIGADESDYLFDATSLVNNLPITSPAINITPIGGGRYRLAYIVQEGDNEVSAGEFAIAIRARDNAGNVSDPPASLDPPNELSIDASRPQITLASVSPADGIINIGESLVITVVADQSGYRNHEDTRINNVPVEPGHLTFNDPGNGTYEYTYTVAEGDQAVSPGFLAINIVLQDAEPFSNTSVAYTGLTSNTLSIVTDRPSASLSGADEICSGDSAQITILLSGTPPWILDMSDGSVVTTSSSTYQLWVHPEVTTDYTVERVEDGTGNDSEGTGNALITVNGYPDVQILNLRSTYPVEGQPVQLEYTPPGGTFEGRGITGGPPWMFDPGLADTVNSPHEITYSVTDENSCTSSDTRMVNVVGGTAIIWTENEYACFNDQTFMITGSNVYGTTGSFSIRPEPPSGAFEDLENNTAILRPDLYNLTEDRTVTIWYTFTDTGGSIIDYTQILTIEYLEHAEIDLILATTMCQNVEPLELSGNYDSSNSYTFAGPGVVDTTEGYVFYPDIVQEDSIWIIYEHTSDHQCRVSDSVELIIEDAPIADFILQEPCVLIDGGMVQFVNRSDTGSDISYLWQLEYPSTVPEDISEEEDPTHNYDTGTYMVRLIVHNLNCLDELIRPIYIRTKPIADFIWNSDCESDDPVILTGTEILHGSDSTVSWTWNINRSGTEIFSSDTSGHQISYDFLADSLYTIGYGIKTRAGCTDSAERTISLSPTYLLAQEPYFEGFELAHGWVTMAEISQPSWTFETINPAEFPGNAASGTRAWYTSLPENRTAENSWVLSPCFSFEDFYRPMVSLDIKRSLVHQRDGAALQYTIDHGKTWHNVGDVDDGGINWYNSTNIFPSIGYEENTGWTGVVDNQWVGAAHHIDEVAGEKEVRFRVAFGSLGDAASGFNDGFALDNFNIRQRTRFSLLEYFTNANDLLCMDADSTIMKIMNEAAPDVIDVQYHAAGSLPDQLNIETPFPAINRGTYYGVSIIPAAILDGGIYSDELGYEMIYDFRSRTPSLADIKLRSLQDPDFNLTITMEEVAPSPRFSVIMEATRDLERRERTLYGIVLQRRVEDPGYEGTSGITVFRQVARRLLPDAGGHSLGNKSWVAGESESTVLTWNEPKISLVEGNVSIVVFIQDEETGEILQAATNPAYVVSTFDELDPPARISMYPNPARELVNVYFEESSTGKMRFTLYDLSGKMVITDVIEPWQQQFTRTLDDLEQGMYIVEIRSWDKRKVLYRDKLLHY